MGTNYYYHDKEPCPCCKREYESKHIGKSSFGWCFSLHVYPDEGISDLDDWIKLFNEPGTYILDEYGNEISVEKILDVITNRRGASDSWDDFEKRILLLYSSEEDFHRRNYSERGPNYLLRHSLRGNCIKHGVGTWDCLINEFS